MIIITKILQGSIDSQDGNSLAGHVGRWQQERKSSLARSQTDSNITYTGDEIPEAPGSICYITKDGDIDFNVVLKVVKLSRHPEKGLLRIYTNYRQFIALRCVKIHHALYGYWKLF